MSESGMTLGEFLREQRSLARLSLREMARLTRVSNAYLSQIERGLHAPSLRVLRAVADVLEVPVEDLVNLDDGAAKPVPSVTTPSCDVETAIKRDPRLSERHKQALLALYLSCVEHDRPS
jgi:transcriptional regulator with XRE-family HTH domain